MKKTMSLILAFLMVVALFAGCSNQNAETTDQDPVNSDTTAQTPSDSSEENDDGTTQADSDKIKVGWIKQTSTEYYTEFEKYIKKSIETEFGADNVEFLGWFDSDSDIEKQLDQVRTLVTMDADFILCCAINPGITADLLACVEGTDTHLIFTNMQPDHDYLKNNGYKNITTFIGSDETHGGNLQGEAAAEELKARGFVPGTDVINVVILMGDLGNPNVTMRTDGAKEALEASGFEINYVAEQSGNFDRTQGLDITTQLLGTGQQIDVIIANNDDMALGAIEALKAVGKEKDVVVCGLDGTINAYYAIKEGTLLMTASQKMSNSTDQFAKTMRDILEGNDFELAYWMPYDIVDASNVDEYIAAAEAGEAK